MKSEVTEEFRKIIYSHRLALNFGDDSSKETPEYWDLAAEKYSNSAHSTKGRADAEKFLNKFKWEKDESILDVACGPGTYAIPLIKRGCKVVGIDFSHEMLRHLKIQANKENIQNIETIEKRWLETDFDKQFDTVLCLNSLGVISTDNEHKARIEKCLIKLKELTKKRLIILIPHSDSILDEEMRKILGENQVSLERLRIALIYFAMVAQGMLPSLEITTIQNDKTFSDLEEVCNYLLKKGGITNISVETKNGFKQYIKSIIKENADGSLRLTYTTKQAIFTVEL